MATDIAGLFGMNPQMYEQNVSNQALDRGIQLARLSPSARAHANLYSSGAQLGRGIGSMLGAEDPQLKIISLRQQVSQNMNPDDLNSVQQAVETLARGGDQPGALTLASYLRKAHADYSLIQQRTAERMTTEQRNAEAIAGLMDVISRLENMPASPERNSALTMRKNQLTSLTAVKPDRVADPIQVSREIGILTGALAKTQEGTLEYNNIKAQINRLERSEKVQATSPLGKLLNERSALDPVKDKDLYDIYTQNIQKIVSGEGLTQAIASGFGLLGQALAPALKKEGEKTGEFSAANFNALGSAVAAGTSSVRNLSTLETALQNAFTGKFAEGKEGVVTSLSALGIPIGSDLKEAATNTQLIQAMGVRYVFPLVKNYPGSLAAKELASLEKTAPNAIQQPETIQRLVNLLRVDLAENKYTYDRAKEYSDKNKTTIGFKEADQRIEFQTKLNNLQGLVSTARRNKLKQMTKSQAEQIQQLKSELGL